jgi:hypothetical protein
MNTQEVADKLVALCRQGKFDQAYAELYHPEVVSIEPKGAPVEMCEGLEAVLQKNAHWNSMVEAFHGGTVSDPLVQDDHFSCAMSMDITMKGAGRMDMSEIAVYKVAEGKIVREQFFFTPMSQG